MPSKLNLVVRLQHWMDSVPGQTFLNYAYSWGASVVILGALFKLTHLPGGNLMLFLGMGTEAFVFFLAAFDRPFDKNEAGKALADDFETDEEIARAEGMLPGAPVIVGGGIAADGEVLGDAGEAAVGQTVAGGQSVVVGGVPAGGVVGGGVAGGVVAGGGSGTIIIGGGSAAEGVAEQPAEPAAPVDPLKAAVDAIYNTPEGERTVEAEADKLATIIRLANDELLRRAQAVLSPEMEAATEEYIEKLRTLNDTLAKVDEQSARLTRDSQEMENLNRTLIGINKVYDLHFASISRQVTTIEDINDQTRQLAQKIEEVNAIYARMMQQLGVMVNPMGAVAQPAAEPAE